MEDNNDIECCICYNNIEPYICTFTTCEHFYCFPCILQTLFNAFPIFRCPQDTIPIKRFVIRNAHNNAILFSINVNNYEVLREKILLDINIEHKEFLIPLRILKPALFWVECKISNGLFNIQDLTNIFQQYGVLQSIIEKENCCYIRFSDIITTAKRIMIPEINVEYFEIEELDPQTNI